MLVQALRIGRVLPTQLLGGFQTIGRLRQGSFCVTNQLFEQRHVVLEMVFDAGIIDCGQILLNKQHEVVNYVLQVNPLT